MFFTSLLLLAGQPPVLNMAEPVPINLRVFETVDCAGQQVSVDYSPTRNNNRADVRSIVIDGVPVAAVEVQKVVASLGGTVWDRLGVFQCRERDGAVEVTLAVTLSKASAAKVGQSVMLWKVYRGSITESR